MGISILNKTNEELVIENFIVLPDRSGKRVPGGETKTVPPGKKHRLKTHLDIHRELNDRLGFQEFRFWIGNSNNSATLTRSDLKNANCKLFVFRIGPEGRLTCTTLQNTKCRISNKTDKRLLIKHYFDGDVPTGVVDDGTFHDELLPGKSNSLKFSPSDIDWNAKEHWKQMEFHFSVDDQKPVELTLDDFKGVEEYAFQIGVRGLECKPIKGRGGGCWPF